jgi:hypothetical protein
MGNKLKVFLPALKKAIQHKNSKKTIQLIKLIEKAEKDGYKLNTIEEELYESLVKNLQQNDTHLNVLDALDYDEEEKLKDETQRIEFLLAHDDGTWTTEIHKVPVNIVGPEPSTDRIAMWFERNKLSEMRYRNVVLVTLYCTFPD